MCSPVTNKEIISGRWQIQEELGCGGQATVYKALDMSTNNQVAVKINTEAHDYRPLLREKWAYEQIMAQCGGEHESFIPTLHDYEHDGADEILVVDLMGPSLHSLMNTQRRPFQFEMVIHFFKRTLRCIESLHEAGRVHRDIKPDNICVGKELNIEDIRLIDLGFCVPYLNEKTGVHNEMVYQSGLRGTVQYCSLNQQLGGSASRLDDLEALCYSMMWLLTGSLPWSNPNGQRQSKAETFGFAVYCKSRKVGEICVGYPKNFEEFLLYVKSLHYNSEPDYAHLHNILDGAALHLE